jgi:hypothetical protein
MVNRLVWVGIVLPALALGCSRSDEVPLWRTGDVTGAVSGEDGGSLPLSPPTLAPVGVPATLLPGGAVVPDSESLRCALRRLAETPVRAEPAPIDFGWRLRLSVYVSPPSGLLDKGSLIHDGARIAYVPNGATRGLADREVQEAVDPILEACR